MNKDCTPDNTLLVDYKTVCQMLSVGKNAFFNMKATGRFPITAIRLGGRVRYNKKQIERWVESNCPVNWRAGR